jgi:hypothetical protein
MILSGGYATKYKMAEVRKRAEYAARAINKMMTETGATSVVVHGNSGVSCGFAALMLSPHEDFNIVLLRKDNDNSHGSPIEGPEGHRLGRYLILDDFMSTGTTMDRIRDKIATLSQQYGLPEDTPECVGIVLYGYHSSDSFKFADGHTVPARGRRSL